MKTKKKRNLTFFEFIMTWFNPNIIDSSLEYVLIWSMHFWCRIHIKIWRSTMVFVQLLPYSCSPASTVAVVAVLLDCHLCCCQQQLTYFVLVTDNPFSVIYLDPLKSKWSKNKQLLVVMIWFPEYGPNFLRWLVFLSLGFVSLCLHRSNTFTFTMVYFAYGKS